MVRLLTVVADSKFMVKIFITPGCPYCYTLKEFLKENKIEFVEVDVTHAKNRIN